MRSYTAFLMAILAGTQCLAQEQPATSTPPQTYAWEAQNSQHGGYYYVPPPQPVPVEPIATPPVANAPQGPNSDDFRVTEIRHMNF